MIIDLLNIQKGVTAVIGGGGKTTLLHTLAGELMSKGSVIITTSTHILKSDVYKNVLTNINTDLSFVAHEISRYKCICMGELCENGKLKVPHFSFADLCTIADFVLVEADGSKGLPLKAHESFEPVIPADSTQVILLAGVDAMGKKLCDVTHRADIACSLLSCENTAVVTEKMVAQLINIEALHTKVVINKCDTNELKHTAEKISEYINTECIISSLLKGEWYACSN